MEQNRKEAYYRLEINTSNGGAMVSDFVESKDDWALVEAIARYTHQPLRHGFILHKYDQFDTSSTFHLIGKYEESTAIG